MRPGYIDAHQLSSSVALLEGSYPRMGKGRNNSLDDLLAPGRAQRECVYWKNTALEELMPGDCPAWSGNGYDRVAER